MDPRPWVAVCGAAVPGQGRAGAWQRGCLDKRPGWERLAPPLQDYRSCALLLRGPLCTLGGHGSGSKDLVPDPGGLSALIEAVMEARSRRV